MAPARQRITDGQAGSHYYPRAAFESEGAFRKDFGRTGAWSGCARRERVSKNFRFHWERNSPDSEMRGGYWVLPHSIRLVSELAKDFRGRNSTTKSSENPRFLT